MRALKSFTGKRLTRQKLMLLRSGEDVDRDFEISSFSDESLWVTGQALYARTTVHKEKKASAASRCRRAHHFLQCFNHDFERLVSGLLLWCEMHSFHDFLLELWSGHVQSTPAATTTTGCYGAVGASYFLMYSVLHDNV